jgi:hypothetical protein
MSLKQKRDFLKVVDTVPVVGSRVAREEIELLKEKTIQLIANNPEKAAIILSSWLSTALSVEKKKQEKKAA